MYYILASGTITYVLEISRSMSYDPLWVCWYDISVITSTVIFVYPCI